MPEAKSRRFAVGAEFQRERGTHFRVWAPAHQKLEVVERQPQVPDAGRAHALQRDADGYFAGVVSELGPGSLYSFRLDGGVKLYPDPASRFQPEGPHGPSEVVDPEAYRWNDAGFAGAPERGQVIYEMHIGTFTREGTYLAAAAQLPELRKLGVTTLELMPLADFVGRFGWGYDGVDLWAPTRLYGRPDELRRFIDVAHENGLAVILDVLYNHLGPDGNYLAAFAPQYFSKRYENEWGEPLNFDDTDSAAVREFFVENARFWIEEYHFDGLRLDATQSIHDASPRHVIADITEAARRGAEHLGKRVFIVAENEPQDARVARPVADGGYGCDALWNDDFHHSATVALTRRHEAYYCDYRGTPQELISAVRWGYLFQGQHYYWQKHGRGRPALDMKPGNFVTYIQNHDQVANSIAGDRIDRLTGAPRLRAMTALLLLAPPIPMLFQGQEFAASAPFLYFADQNAELSPLIDRDRRKFLEQFQSIKALDAGLRLDSASDLRTFERCKLDFGERESHAPIYALHRDLLALRHSDPAFRQARADLVHGAVLSADAFVLRFLCEQGDRLLIVNLGPDLELRPAPEPLLAPPLDSTWEHLLSTEHPKYGGTGFMPPLRDAMWKLSAESAHVFAAASVASESEPA